MNKKQYIAPALEIEEMEIMEMLCGSLTGVSGNSGIDFGDDDEIPDNAD